VTDSNDPGDIFAAVWAATPLALLLLVPLCERLARFGRTSRVRWVRLRQRSATPWLLAMRSTFPMRRYLLRRAQAETERKMLAHGFEMLLRQRGERR
jgi:hypothetical protein